MLLFFNKGLNSLRKQVTYPRSQSWQILRNSVSTLPTPKPFPLPNRFFPRPRASSGGGRLVEGKTRVGVDQNPRAPGSALRAGSGPVRRLKWRETRQARLAGSRRSRPGGAQGPLPRAGDPHLGALGQPEAGGPARPWRFPGILTELRARGGATRDWLRGVGGGAAAGRPGGRRQ